MDQTLISYLKKYDIQYTLHNHLPVFTVEEHNKIKHNLPEIFHTKNLFLKDDKNNFYLVCMAAETRLDMKSLAKKINARKLTFGSPVELKEHLNILPGHVSIFCMIYTKIVRLILDKKIWDAEKVGFHPNENSSTLELTHTNLEKFYNSLNSEKTIMEV